MIQILFIIEKKNQTFISLKIIKKRFYIPIDQSIEGIMLSIKIL